MEVGAEVVLPIVSPAVVVDAVLPRLNALADDELLLPRLNPLDVVVVELPKLNEGVVAGVELVILKPDPVVVGAPMLKPVPVIVTEVVVAVEASPKPFEKFTIISMQMGRTIGRNIDLIFTASERRSLSGGRSRGIRAQIEAWRWNSEVQSCT